MTIPVPVAAERTQAVRTLLTSTVPDDVVDALKVVLGWNLDRLDVIVQGTVSGYAAHAEVYVRIWTEMVDELLAALATQRVDLVRTDDSQAVSRDKLEEKVAAIVRVAFGGEEVGRNDDLFELGLDSLRLIRIYQDLELVFRRDVRMQDLFEHRTISSLAEWLGARSPSVPADEDWRSTAVTAHEMFLLWGAAEAPFSKWAARGIGEGVALSLVDRLRTLVEGSPPLSAPVSSSFARWQLSEQLSAERWLRFRSLVEGELHTIAGSRFYLQRVRELFKVNLSEIGELFGASRQAVAKWLRDGLPASRQSKAATIVALGELLQRKLRPGRLPAVLRRRAAAYGNRTMLDRIAADEHEELLAEVRESFDWAATA